MNRATIVTILILLQWLICIQIQALHIYILNVYLKTYISFIFSV